MRKTNIRPYIAISLVGMIISTYPLTLVNAQETSSAKDGIQSNKITLLLIKELEKQGITLEQISSELPHQYENKQSTVQKKEQSSLSLREFSMNSLFSCRGLT